MEIIEFLTNDGETIFVEIESSKRGTYRGDNETTSKTKQKFDDAIGSIKSVMNSVVEVVKSQSTKPDEIEVKIGLKFNVEAGVIIAKTSTEGNLEITMKWGEKKLI